MPHVRQFVFSSLPALALGVALTFTAGCGDKAGPAKQDDKVVPADPAKDAPKKDADKPAPPKDDTAKDAASKDAGKAQTPDKPRNEPISLFDGKTLGKWKATNFGGEGEVEIKDGQLIVHFGAPLSGITWQGEPPLKMNYELSLEAARLEGDDFFVGLTVPVNDSHISLIMGGWGGTLVGLSSLDGQDASENEYTQYMNFKKEQWYKVRLVVKEQSIQAYIDDKLVIDAITKDRKIETRIEVDLSKPLGIATFATTGAYRNIQMKKLD